MGNEQWCSADDCPASVCGGPHRAVETSLGTELLRTDQDPIGAPVIQYKKVAGYGRYPDGHVGCPRAKSDMSPCIARDGRTASSEGKCVFCGEDPYKLLVDLVKAATDKDE